MESLLTQISAVAASSLVTALWEGLVLAACVALCLRLLPGITAAARSVVWSAAMVMAVLLPFIHFSGASATGFAAARQLHLDMRLSVALVCVWAGLSLWRGAQLISSALYLRGVDRNATPIAVEPGVAALLTYKRKVALCVSDEVDRPSVTGFFSPRILLPSSLLAKLTVAELEQIVLHEMEHLRRGDDWTNLLQKLSLVLFPLNPVLLWIERRLCLERELACDDQVLRVTNARKAYAACLANLAEHSLVRRGVSLALGAWERQSEVVRRVHRILTRPAQEMGRGQAGVAVGVMLCGLLAGADALAHSPQLVSFTANGNPAAEAQLLPASPVSGRVVGGHITMAKAIMPESRSNTTALAAKKVVRRHRINRTIRPALLAAEEPLDPSSQSAGMVVLVNWRVVTQGTVHSIQSSQFSYAAVPVRNGWLFLQL